MNAVTIAFNDSNLYFPNAETLQSRIWFVNPIDIDVFVQKSFEIQKENMLMSGAYIKVFNSSHVISDTFLVYKIHPNANQNIFQTKGKITFKLENQWIFSGGLIKKILQSMPLISIMLLMFITFLMPTNIAKIFGVISLIGMIILIFVYGWKIAKIMYKLLTSKGIDYDGVIVYFENQHDILKIKDTHIQTLKLLNEINILEIVLVDGVFYLKQEVNNISLRQTIINMFKKRNTDDALIVSKIYETMDFLLTDAFIWWQTQTSNDTNPTQQN